MSNKILPRIVHWCYKYISHALHRSDGIFTIYTFYSTIPHLIFILSILNNVKILLQIVIGNSNSSIIYKMIFKKNNSEKKITKITDKNFSDLVISCLLASANSM